MWVLCGLCSKRFKRDKYHSHQKFCSKKCWTKWYEAQRDQLPERLAAKKRALKRYRDKLKNLAKPIFDFSYVR